MAQRNTKPNLPALAYNGAVIHEQKEMLSLTDMWRAAGSPEDRRPAEWLRSADAVRFIDALRLMSGMGNSHTGLVETKKGGLRQGTWAHWQVALAYAKYLSPEFHMWCNTVVRERMEGGGREVGLPGNLAALREIRLFMNRVMGLGKQAGLTGNHLLLASNIASKKVTGFDWLGAMGITHLVAADNDPLVIPSKIGADLGGVSAIRVNHMLQEIGFQVGDRDHKDRPFWKLTEAGEAFGGVLVDVERNNGTGQAQHIKWPSRIVDVLREHMNKGA